MVLVARKYMEFINNKITGRYIKKGNFRVI